MEITWSQYMDMVLNSKEMKRFNLLMARIHTYEHYPYKKDEQYTKSYQRWLKELCKLDPEFAAHMGYDKKVT